MSSPLAIAGVTQVLKDLLNDGLINHNITASTGSTVAVTSLPPDRIDIEPGISQLNLFMYQATLNPGWRNEGQPSFNSRGDRIGNPPLALDLHYMLSAYGGGIELHSEILLGYGMQLFHETPVLSREAIRRSLGLPAIDSSANQLPLALRTFSTSGLADQVEQIKIVPESLNSEDISKLWTAFGAKYRPTAAYKASVVLIESNLPTKTALPVLERKIYVVPFHQPVIEKVNSQASDTAPVIENQKILAGYNLVIQGYQLRSEEVKINVGGIEATPADGQVTDSKIVIKIPADLQSGIHGVQVVHPMLMGSPPELHNGVSSNAEAFILSPAIVSHQVSNLQGGVNNRSADILLTISPAIGEKQRVVLLLNEFTPAGAPSTGQGYSFQMDSLPLLSPPAPVEDITIPVAGVRAGIYLIRIQVDGVESALTRDASGRFTDPQIVL